jgi:malonyl CoA-acyl carrier protein transacylase
MGEATAILFPGQGSHADGMRELVERYEPELAALAVEEVGEDPFSRAGEATRFAQPAS